MPYENLTRKQSIYAKIESTVNSPETLTAANRVLCTDISATPLESTLVERQLIRPFVGNFAELVGGDNKTMLQITTELAGGGLDGTTGREKVPNHPQIDTLLRACNMNVTYLGADGTAESSQNYATNNDIRAIRYTPGDPSSRTGKTATIRYQLDKIKQIVSGAIGTFTMSLAMTEIPTLVFEFTAGYSRPLKDTTLPAGTKPIYIVPQVVSQDHTRVKGFPNDLEKCMSSFNFDIGNTISTLQCATDTFGTGLEILFTDRRCSGDVTVAAVVDTTNANSPQPGDPWSKAGTGEPVDISESISSNDPQGFFRHGTKNGNIVTFGSANVTLGQPTQGETEEYANYNIPLRFLPVDPGNNDFTLTFWGNPTT